MSLTLPDKYTTFARMNGAAEDWLIRLYYGDESSYTGIAFQDVVVDSVQYYGVIQDIDAIQHKLNIKKQTASKQDVSITCINKFKSGTLGEELFAGSNKYINRKVEIYSILSLNNDPSAVADGVKIYVGNLKSVSLSDDGLLNLDIEHKILGAGIEIPDTISSRNIYYPVAYGDFEHPDPDSVFDNKKVYPCPQDSGAVNYGGGSVPEVIYLTTNDVDTDECAFYLDGADQFGSVDDSVGESDKYFRVDATYGSEAAIRPYKENTDYAGNGDFDNPENAYDYWDDSTYGTSYAKWATTISQAQGVVSKSLYLDIPQVYRRATTIKVYYRISLIITNQVWDIGEDPGVATHVYIDDDTGGTAGGDRVGAWDPQNDGNGTYASSAANNVLNGEQSGIGSVYCEVDNITEADLDYRLPDMIKLEIEAQAIGASTAFGIDVRVYDVYIHADFTEEYISEDTKREALKNLLSVKHVYSGQDGLNQTYTDNDGGIADLPHEIHRDLLVRYAGFDVDNDDLDGWTTLNTNRSGWTCNWWQLDPRSLIEILEQLQFEGCFMFIERPDGAKYISIANSYGAGDEDFNFDDDDFNSLEVFLSSLDDMETSNTYNYHRHPNPNISTYLKTRTYTNSTARTNWNIATEENLLTYNLEFITADQIYESGSDSNPNDCVALYRDKFFGEPKIMVRFNLTNMQYYGIELGDIFRADSDVVKPFAKTWSDLHFLTIETKRKPGEIEVIGYLVDS